MIRRALLLGVQVLMLAGLLTGRRAAGVPTVHHQLTCSGSWYCEEHTADDWTAYASGNRYGYEQQPDGSWKRFDSRQGTWASHMANECGAP